MRAPGKIALWTANLQVRIAQGDMSANLAPLNGAKGEPEGSRSSARIPLFSFMDIWP